MLLIGNYGSFQPLLAHILSSSKMKIVLLVMALFASAVVAADGVNLAEMLYAPQLLQPNKKPIGPVYLDRTHPLAGGLRYALLLNEGASEPLNHADNRRMTGTASWGTGPYGVELSNTQYNDYEPALNSATGGEHSVFIFGKPGALNSDQGIFNYSPDQRPLFWLDRVASTLRVAAYSGGTPAYGSTTVTTLRYLTAGASIVWNGSSFIADAYLDGVQEYSGQNIGSNSANGLSLLENESADKVWTGEVVVFYYWYGRKLSEAEHQSLHRDPFQLFKVTGMHGLAFKAPEAAASGSVPPFIFQQHIHGLTR